MVAPARARGWLASAGDWPSPRRGSRMSSAVPMALCLCTLALLPSTAEGYIGAVDLGSQFFKAAIVKPGKPFEVVHNQHSKRKTPTAVSFHEAVRTFGDDALASASKGAAKTPMLFPLQLGRNLTSVSSDSFSWLPASFYPYKLAATEHNGLAFVFSEDVNYTIEEAAAHVLGFVKKISGLAADGGVMTESILTVPAKATYLQRLAMLTAGEIAGLPRPQLVHETSAAALQRALDLDLSGSNGTRNESYTMFYNMGARHVEVCIVHYKGATHSSKPTVAMDVLGCGYSEAVGGHQIDLVIAEKMLKSFQAKQPKLADGIMSSVRALRKLEKEAMGTKHVLSANKDALFRVESLFEDTDFSQPITREELETLCAEIFSQISVPAKAALEAAGAAWADIDEVEMIGGGWRVPKVQSMLSDFLKSERPSESPVLNLSQHVNGEEGIATGAAFFAANSSVSFRVKRIFFTDSIPHGYSLHLAPLNASQPHEDGWQRGVTLFPPNSKLKSRKTVKVNISFDLQATLLEGENVVAKWDIDGIYDAATGKYAGLGVPLVSLKVDLDSSGVVRLSSATAIFDEVVNVTETAPVAKPVATNESSNASESTADGEQQPTNETEAGSAEGGDSGEASEAGSGEKEEGGAESDGAEEEVGSSRETAVNASGSETTTVKTKVKKRKVSLQILDIADGLRLSDEAKEAAIARLAAMERADAEVQRVEAAKNSLESFIYEAREKLSSDENVLTVSEESTREEIIANLSKMEEWLYEDGFYVTNASDFEDRLDELHLAVGPILRRAQEYEFRPQLPEIVEKVLIGINKTLDYVRLNMTWVAATEREGLANMSAAFDQWYSNVTAEQAELPLTAEPAYSVAEVKRRLEKLNSEAMRLQKIKKIDYDYSKYGSGYGSGRSGGYDDPRMRAYYEAMMRNFSGNGSNRSEWWRNSNFSGFNDTDSEYWRSFYEYAARNFSGKNFSTENGTSSEGNTSEEEASHSEL
mmetsp:Transcript_63813/g.152188  ORF Transcript_63813/g.152188 Transcript_63813/m.152188 type:complete len:986 (+) Transcript_63813:96-3053(+)